MFKHFNGRIIQVIEALDIYDACSNYVVNIDGVLKNEFSVHSQIYVNHVHPDRKQLVHHISSLHVNDEDIIIFHFSGVSEVCAKSVIQKDCLKIMSYHNITPYHFFDESTQIYTHCKRGREQLNEIIHQFDFAIGDSDYNFSRTNRTWVSC